MRTSFFKYKWGPLFANLERWIFVRVGILPPVKDKTEKELPFDYRDLSYTLGRVSESKYPLNSWGVSQSKGHVGISSRKRMVPTIFSWETISMAVAQSLCLAAKVKNISDKGTKAENLGNEGGVWVGMLQHPPKSQPSFLFIFPLSLVISTHLSPMKKINSKWDLFLEFPMKKSYGTKQAKRQPYDDIGKEKPWRTEISMRILSHLPWNMQLKLLSPPFWHKLFSNIY